MRNIEKIKLLESRNSELAKEILLNESAIYEAEKEISNLDMDLIEHPKILEYVNQLKFLIGRLTEKNNFYKTEIFQNDLEIKKLLENE